jgi:hypothetical protein
VFLIYLGIQLLGYHGVVASDIILAVHSQVPRFVIGIGGGCYTPHILPK